MTERKDERGQQDKKWVAENPQYTSIKPAGVPQQRIDKEKGKEERKPA